MNQRAPPEPYIDDADTNPELLSVDDTEKERDIKLNYVKKYSLRDRGDEPKQYK